MVYRFRNDLQISCHASVILTILSALSSGSVFIQLIDKSFWWDRFVYFFFIEVLSKYSGSSGYLLVDNHCQRRCVYEIKKTHKIWHLFNFLWKVSELVLNGILELQLIMDGSDWRDSIITQLRTRNKHETAAFQDIIAFRKWYNL